MLRPLRHTHLNALISTTRVTPPLPALLHGSVVVALVIVARRRVRVSVERHAVALVLFQLPTNLGCSFGKMKKLWVHKGRKLMTARTNVLVTRLPLRIEFSLRTPVVDAAPRQKRSCALLPCHHKINPQNGRF